MGYACQSCGPLHRNVLCWLLRAGSGSGSGSGSGPPRALKWGHRRGGGAGGGGGGGGDCAPSRRVGVGAVLLWFDSGIGRHGLDLELSAISRRKKARCQMMVLGGLILLVTASDVRVRV